MDDFRSLRHFIEVARQGSFTVAAAKLALSTPALSKSIAGLEKRMGLRLFVRTTRSVHLSGEGQVLFDRLSPSFESIEMILNEVGATSRKLTGLVRVSTVTAFGKHCIVPLLPEFFALHPGIEIAMSFHDGARGLTRQSYDVRINWGEEREQNKVAQVIGTMSLILIGSPDYLARYGTPLTPEDLTQHQCIAVAPPGGSRYHWRFAKRNVRKHSTKAEHVEFMPKGNFMVMDELDAVVDAALVGLGLTVVSADLVLEHLRNGSLIRLLPNYEISGSDPVQVEIIMQYPARNQISPKVEVLVNFLLDKLRRRSPQTTDD